MSGANTSITFCGVPIPRLGLGARLPVPKPRCRIKEHFMTEGGAGSGIRVIEPLGAHASYGDIAFVGEMLTAGNIETFLSEFYAQRTPKTLTITNVIAGSAVYNVLFDADGFDYDMMDDLSDYDDPWPYKALFKLKILNRIS